MVEVRHYNLRQAQGWHFSKTKVTETTKLSLHWQTKHTNNILRAQDKQSNQDLQATSYNTMIQIWTCSDGQEIIQFGSSLKNLSLKNKTSIERHGSVAEIDEKTTSKSMVEHARPCSLSSLGKDPAKY